MKEFLTNDICKFEILNKVDLLENKVNILTSVFFKRNEYYKNFGIYVRGLQKVLAFVDDKNNNPDENRFIFVLFIDHNIANDETLMRMINNSRNTVPVKFHCEIYIKNNYHQDLFGTLIRFFPMFDFPNNETNITICIDIDLHDEDYVRLQCIMKHKIKGVTASADIVRLIYENKAPYIYAHLVSYNSEKYDHRIIMDFILNAENIKSKGIYGKRLTPFGFGVDEIFLNDFLLPEIKNYKCIIDYQISYFLYHSNSRIIDKNKIDQSTKILPMILGDLLTVDMNVSEMLNFIDKNTYGIRNRTDINNELSRRYTSVIEYLEESKKHWLEKNVQHFVHKYLKNIISACIVLEITYDTKLNDVKIYNAVHDNDYVNPAYVKEKIISEAEKEILSVKDISRMKPQYLIEI